MFVSASVTNNTLPAATVRKARETAWATIQSSNLSLVLPQFNQRSALHLCTIHHIHRAMQLAILDTLRNPSHQRSPPPNPTTTALLSTLLWEAWRSQGTSRVAIEVREHPQSSHEHSTGLLLIYGTAKRTKIEDLLCINGFPPPPPTPSQPIPEPVKEQMKQIWSTVYAPGIDKFLETTWYVSRGEPYLLADQRLCEQFVSLIYRFQAIPQNDPNYPLYLSATYSLEAKVIWQMISMCRTAASPSKSESVPEAGADEEDVKNGLRDAVRRMETFEALVTGEYLSSDNAPSSTEEAKSNGTALGDQLKTREIQFWNLIHTFLTIRDDEASAAREIDDTISSARSLLDSRENRDVIYSIMIARHIGARIAEFPDNLPQPTSNEEADNKNKLHVAKRFIEGEAMGKGTNQVVQRLCGMAARSWGQAR